MREKQTLKGFWWSPSAPEQRLFGELAQTEKGIELVCHADPGSAESAIGSSCKTIHGKDEKGRPVTLLVIILTGSSSSGGMVTVRLHVGYVLIGTHVADHDMIRIKTLNLRLQHLYGWLGVTGFSRMVNASVSGRMSISYDRPTLTRHQIRKDLNLEFAIATEYSASVQSESISEEASVLLTHKEGFSFRECWEMSLALRLLLHLAVLKPVYAVSMALGGCGDEVSDPSIPPQEVSVWSMNFREAKTEFPLDGIWVFRYGDLVDDFGKFFSHWLDYTNRHSEAVECYTATVYHRLPASVEHLCLTQALDAYYGSSFNSHDNGTFRAKMQELLKKAEIALSGLISDSSAFAERVVITRNYYTHHNPRWLATGKVASDSELIRMNEVLRILFQSCVLTDVGLPIDRMGRLRRQIATQIVNY